MLWAMRNWDRWSETDKVILPKIILGDIALEKILSIRVLELLFILFSWSIWGKNTWKDKESRNSIFFFGVLIKI